MLREHFASFGDINQWVPLQAFGRIIVVYEVSRHAEVAKLNSDPIEVSHEEGYVYFDSPALNFLICVFKSRNIVLRVYRADFNPLKPRGENGTSWIPQSSYLQPPPVEKNFLISPPGSPPIGWEQIREDPPNSTPLANDLIVALKKLKTHEESHIRPAFEQLLDPMDMDGPGVGVYVENCDDPVDEFGLEVTEEEWVYGETAPARQKWGPVPTSLPPMTANFG